MRKAQYILKLFLLVFLFTLSCSNCYSQGNVETDSLKQVLKTAKDDTSRCNVLNMLIELLDESEWPTYNKELKGICEKQLKGRTKNDPLRNFYLKHMATALSNEGLNYENQGDALNAIEFYHQSLKIQEEIKDRYGISSTFFNIGGLYKNQHDPEKALEYYEKSLKKSEEICATCEEKQDKNGMAFALTNIGFLYHDKHDTTKAKENFLKALQLMKEVGNRNGTSYVLNSMGTYYFKERNLPQALEYYKNSYAISKEIHDVYGMASTLNNISDVLFGQGKLDEAQKAGEESYKLSVELGFPNILLYSSHTLSTIYSKKGNWKKAYEMQILYKQMSDSILSETNRKASIKKDFQYRYEKKAAADSVKTEQEHKIFAAQIKQEKTQRMALYIGIILVAVFSVFMYNRFRITNKQKKLIEIKEKETQLQKHIIEEKHKEISDSINYAERIQRSFMATKQMLDKNLSEYFVLFKPKDVVSGDFYWSAELENGHFAFATADSTGHGVPGAIMSLLNITSLEKATEHHTNPAEILNHARKNIIDRLKKDGSIDGGKDGMDCTLLVFDLQNKQLKIASANNPVWIIRKNEVGLTELIDIKPDKMPVGKHDRDQQPFTLHVIDLIKGDTIYTLTDGFPDQFGGPSGKKFMSKKLKELLLANYELPIDSQKQLLEKTFKDWIGTVEQIDDVSVVGIKI